MDKNYYTLTRADRTTVELNLQLKAGSLADAQTAAQSMATILAMPLRLTSFARFDSLTSPWEYVYEPGEQGSTVSAPSGVARR